MAAEGTKARGETVAGVEARMARLRDLYEPGDIERGEYLARREELERRRAEVEHADEPTFIRQDTPLRSLVDEGSHGRRRAQHRPSHDVRSRRRRQERQP